MNFEELKNIFNNVEYFGEKLVVKQELARTITFIKENYHFDVLKNITAVDGGEEIELIYFLYNSEDDENLQISTTVKEEAETVSRIFDSAVADEKEIYDLFGIKFVGNDELKRLYMPESWEGHPLKKDYEEKDVRLNWND
jgi:NADH:ubiquinone oxidoreductase subunit C